MALYLLLGGYDEVVGAGLDEVAQRLDHKVGKEVVGGQNHGYGECFGLLSALTMVRMKLHWN